MRPPTLNHSSASGRLTAGFGLKQIAATAAVLTLVAGGLVVLVGAAPPTSAAKPAATAGKLTTDIAAASVSSFDITTLGRGDLEAKNQVEIRNRLEFETTITELVKEGTIAKAGEVLVKLNADPIDTQIAEVTQGIETAKSELAGAESALKIQINENESAGRKGRLALELAELDLRQWQEGEVRSRRQQLDLALAEAQSELERLTEKLDRSRALYKKEFLSRDELQRDELAKTKAQSALAKAELDKTVFESFQYPKDEKQKRSEVEEAQAELDRIKDKNDAQLATRTADRVNRQQQLDLRETKLKKLQEQLGWATLRAPSDGLVVYGSTVEKRPWNNAGPLQVGQQVYPNKLLIALPDTSVMVASVKVPESVAGRIKAGQTASIKIDALGGKVVTGTVDSIGLLAESGGWGDQELREFSVKIALGPDATGLDIRPSMRVEAQIKLDRAENVLSVPVQAIFAEGPVRFVHVSSGNKWAKRPVKPSQISDRFAAITAGLADGERVLLRAPLAGELINAPWDKAALAAVGLQTNDEGQVVVIPPTTPPTPLTPAVAEAEPADGGGGEAPAKTVAETASAATAPKKQ